MRGQSPFRLVRGRRRNNIPKWLVRRGPSKPSRAPLAKIVLRSSFQRLPKEQPWFPHGSRHYADIGKFLVGCFRSISTSHGHDEANDFSPPLKTRFGKGT